jgi:acetylornithine aminotransferase
MIGIELKEPSDKIVEKALERGIVINLTAQKVIRLAPPMNISRQDWETGLDTVIDTIAAG